MYITKAPGDGTSQEELWPFQALYSGWRNRGMIQKLAWFTWPQNVLLAVTSDGDMNSLPFPAQSYRWLAQFEAPTPEKTSAAAKKLPSCAEVSLDQWHSWEQEVYARTKTAVNAELQEMLDFRQQAFYVALTILKVKDPDTVVEDMRPVIMASDESNKDRSLELDINRELLDTLEEQGDVFSFTGGTWLPAPCDWFR